MTTTVTTTRRFGIYGEKSRELLTYGGRIICHHSREQLEFLHPGVVVREVPPDVPADQCLPIQLHPDYASVQWTADGDIAGKEQFRDAR
ncbi:MAG TPA: hypothetical protein VGF65_02970 [Mycobacterium sp.]|jgi:hypothetical protein